MVFLKRALRYLGYVLVVVLALAIGAVAVLTLTSRGRDNLAALISDIASTPQQQITISGLSGIWSGHLAVDRLVIADPKGPWLAVHDLTADWSPMALLSRTVKADHVSADRIELARLPESGETTNTTSSGSGGLPVSIEIDRIDLPAILLDDQLAGEIAKISANGSLHVERAPLSVQSAMKLARADGQKGQLDADISYLPQENRLDVKLSGSEPAGGVIANLLNIEGAPAVDIEVQGSGPLSDWQGKGTLALDGSVVTRVSAHRKATDSGSRIEASGSGEFDAFLPEGLRPLAAGSTEFEFAGTLADNGGIAIEKARLDSDAVHATASGEIDPGDASDFALQASAKGGPVQLSFGGVTLKLQEATARAFGAGRTPAVDATAKLASIRADQFSAENVTAKLHSDEFDVVSRTGAFSATVTADSAGSADKIVAGLLAGSLQASVSGTLGQDQVTISDSSVKTDATTLTATGAYSRADGSLDVALKGEFLAGVLPAAARKPLGKNVSVSGKLTRGAEGAIAVSDLQLSSGGLTASGSAKMAEETLTADLEGALADVGVLAPQASGSAQFTLSASGPLSGPDLSASVTSDRLETAGRAIENLKLTAKGRADLDNPAAEVNISGTVEGEELSGGATLKTTDGKREISDLALSLGPDKVSGDLVLDDNFVPSGTVKLDLPRLEPLAALALQQVKGAATGTIVFTNDAGGATVSIDATVDSFARGDIQGDDIAVNAKVTDYLNDPVVAGTVSAKTIVSGTTVVSGVDLKLSRDGEWTAFSGNATAAGIPADAQGRVKFADGNVTIELKKANATVASIAVALADPSTVVIAGGQVKLNDFAVKAAGGRASVSGTAGQTLDLQVNLASLPAAAANSFVPGLGASGTISGTAKITGKASDPKVTFDARLEGGQTSQTISAGFGAMTVSANGSFADGTLRFQANVGSGGLGMQGGGTVAISGSKALDLSFSGKVPFDFLAQRLAAQGFSLSGTADVSLSVGGTISSPVIGGSLSSSGARFVDAGSGLAVNDVSMRVSIANNVATIEQLNGSLSSGGTLKASGTVGIDAAKGFPADLSVSLDNGRYTDGRLVTANLDGSLKVTGSLSGTPKIAGTINLGKTVVTIPESLPPSLAQLDVKHRNASAAVTSQDEALRPANSGNGAGGLDLDVQVNAPQQIFVQGRGLNVELGGDLKLTGPASSPQAVGQFTLRRGRLEILGRRLEFKSGSISFAGSLVPYLDLSADSSISDATVTVKVTGPANDPAFAFSSSPALPEDEIMARLVFGKAMSNLSPLQIAQLASAAASLAGVGGSTSLLDKLRAATGVDDIDVKQDDKTGDTSVAVGKYLNDKTYLSIEKGSSAGSGKATIDLDVGKGIKLRGEASESGETKGGIFYEKEY